MEKKIRSISISYGIDEKLILDSKSRGLTISANITRILFDDLNSNKIFDSGLNLYCWLDESSIER